MNARTLFAEGLGTAVLVFVAVGVATLSFGFKMTGLSTSAGVVATALAFGFVLLALVYAIGPVSGCHINPAVTLGFLVGRRIAVRDAIGYMIAQVIGGIAGAALLYGMFHLTATWHKSVGLGANGFGDVVVHPRGRRRRVHRRGGDDLRLRLRDPRRDPAGQ